MAFLVVYGKDINIGGKMKAFNGAHFFKAQCGKWVNFPSLPLISPKILFFFSQVERESDMRSLEEAHNRWAPGDLVGGG